MIKLIDARRGLHEKCVELFHDKKVAESIYMYLCDGIEECDEVELGRKRGEWIPKSESGCIIECSMCGERMTVLGDENPNFCPYCGADMKGGQDERSN